MKTLAAVAVAVGALSAGAPAAVASAPFRVNTSVSNRFLYFADTVSLQVTVLADGRQVAPGSVRLTATFGDWDELTPVRTSSTSTGPFTLRTWSFELACLQPACLPQAKPLTLRLPPVSVSARRLDGSTVTVQQRWPALSLAPRFKAPPPGATPSFQVDQRLPVLAYRTGPSGLALGLDVAAGLLGGFGVCLIAWELLRRRPARVRDVSPLVRALTFLRQAKGRPVDDRRRAAGLLARTLAADRESPLSAAASRVAWSAGEPAPDRLEELARMVETGREEP